MASLLALSTPRLLNVEEFLQIDFGPDLKAELDNGVIRMIAGGTREHARIRANILIALGTRLRGTGCRPFGSDMGVECHDLSLRYPDISVDCGSPQDTDKDTVLSAPRVLIEVLSPSTRDHDLRIKKEEYRAMPTVDTIVFVDPDIGKVSLSQRHDENWTDTPFTSADVPLPSLNLILPYAEIFAQD